MIKLTKLTNNLVFDSKTRVYDPKNKYSKYSGIYGIFKICSIPYVQNYQELSGHEQIIIFTKILSQLEFGLELSVKNLECRTLVCVSMKSDIIFTLVTFNRVLLNGYKITSVLAYIRTYVPLTLVRSYWLVKFYNILVNFNSYE